MTDFAAGDRVRCIDATPLPINCPGALATDFTFPGGFIAEGQVYRVAQVSTCSQGRPALWLEGLPVLLHGVELPWDSLRFRKVGPLGRRKRAARRSARSPAAPAS